MKLNPKPVGPEVTVRIFYDRIEVYSLTATDDDRQLAGLTGEEVAVRVARHIIEQEANDRRLGLIAKTGERAS